MRPIELWEMKIPLPIKVFLWFPCKMQFSIIVYLKRGKVHFKPPTCVTVKISTLHYEIGY